MNVAGFILIGLAAIALAASLALFFRKPAPGGAGAVQEEGLSDITKLVNAITKLVGALQKAGPAVSLLAASIVFAVLGTSLLIADANSHSATTPAGAVTRAP